MSFLLDTDICSAHLKRPAMIGSVALVNNLVLVTHNTADYANITDLVLDDWLVP